jgi:peptidoglycan/LPS O-acetylase OafA/YrhL
MPDDAFAFSTQSVLPAQCVSASRDAESREARPRTGRGIPSLTGVRGIAALWVFCTHAQPVLAAYLAAPDVQKSLFMFNGFRGVDLFFVLSGFILMHVHASEFFVLRADAIRNFYLLRFLRVYPLNTAVLLAVLPIGCAMPEVVAWFRFDHGAPIPYHAHDFSASGFVQTLLLAQSWTFVKLGEWNGPSWTLSAEIAGYAAFPVLALLATRCRSAKWAGFCGAASLVLLIVILCAFGRAGINPTGGFGLVRLVFCFTAGVALSRCHALWPAGARWAGGMTVLALAWVALCLCWRPLNVLVTPAFGLLIFGLSYRRGLIDAILSSRAAVFLGSISFSFYLVHYIPLRLALFVFPRYFAETPLALRLAALTATVAFCIVSAMALHRWVEVPFQRLARGARRARPVGTALRPA